MFDLKSLTAIIDEYAPFNLSKIMIEKGDYDNSGILINSDQKVDGVLFALDLTEDVVKRAKRLKCNTIVTHHPAIYHPISSVDITSATTGAVALALQNKMNVVSAHLNLDVADLGVDYYLAEGLGATKVKILDYVDQTHGYGREFTVQATTVKDFVSRIKKNFATEKVLVYGAKNAKVEKVASFCGAGGSHAHSAVFSGATDAEVIVTSDTPHHVIKDLVNANKILIVITHYASENYGFKKFSESVRKKINGLTQVHFFEDKRLF